ncbi:hypothetical protein [Williamwhitmania taraxaci]|uniref:hypothetical protein n=1 Tax=Williamwhitmania taraxaci TaxID=1640674 RepID=UPI001113823B|nr:hypothetical protein [Williamwhitmania taraxaci]
MRYLNMEKQHQTNGRKRLFRAAQVAVWLLFGLTIPVAGFSQPDSVNTKMKFDFGITRDRNINLWPIFKRTKSDIESDRQVIFPIYQSHQNFKRGEKSLRILPVYWSDSSAKEETKRFISVYYPSLIHKSNNKRKQIKTFTLLEIAPRVNVLEFAKSKDGLVIQNNLLFFVWYKNNMITKHLYLIGFPAYWQYSNPTKESTTLLPLFSYGKYANKQKQYFAATPLFWHFSSLNQSSNLLFPIWWNRTVRVGDNLEKQRLLFPIYFSSKDQSTSNHIIFPLVWSLNNSRYKSLTIAPLISTGCSANGVRRHLMLSPLFWQFKSDVSESTTLFPFVWSHKWKSRTEESSSLVLFPLYWSEANSESQYQIVLPFIYNFNSKNYHTFTFAPFFSVGKTPNGASSHAIVTPLFWHFKSPGRSSNTLLPIWWHRKVGEGEEAKTTSVVFPLYWAWQRQTYGGNILFPLVWRFNNPDYRTFTFAPFYSKGKSSDGKRSYLAATPFYWRFTTEQGEGQLLFPLWYQKDKATASGDSSTSRVAFLYWNYRDAGRNHYGVFPLLWRFQNQTRQSFSIFPLYTHSQTTDGLKSYTAVTPLFWHFAKPQRSSSILFPIWWSRNSGQGGNASYTRLLIPLYYGKKDSLRNNHVAFPIVWSFRNPNYRSLTVLPLFSKGNDTNGDYKHLVVTPLFWYFQKPNGFTTTLFPLVWHSENGNKTTNTIFPVYWSLNDGWRNHRVVFPFVWNFTTPEYRSLTMAPIFSVGKNNDTQSSYYAISPLYWHFKNLKGHNTTLFPVWWSGSSGDSLHTKKYDVLFPLVWSFRKPNHTTNIVFPLIWSFNNPRNRSFTLAPLYSQGTRRNGNRHLMVTPLFWNINTKATHRQMLFPLYSSYSDTAKTKRFDILLVAIRHQSTPTSSDLSILWPIIEHDKAPNYRYFRIAPIVWSKKSAASSYFTIQPFYYHSIDTTRETYRILWELYTFKNQMGVKKSNGVLWKVVTWDRYPNGDRSFRFMHLLYSNVKLQGKEEKSLFPLYYFTKEDNGNRSRSVAFYFYNSFKRLIPSTNDYYQEERIFWFIRLRSNYQMLKDKGVLNNRRL